MNAHENQSHTGSAINGSPVGSGGELAWDFFASAETDIHDLINLKNIIRGWGAEMNAEQEGYLFERILDHVDALDNALKSAKSSKHLA